MLENKSSLFNTVKDNVGRVDVGADFGVVNTESKSSILASDDGSTGMISGEYSQITIDKQSDTITQRTIKSVDVSVQKEIMATDINVNNHKFNNQLIELNDFRDVNGYTMGGIMLNGTILVKTYDYNLEKWVLIRRNIATPMFSQRLNIPEAPEEFGLNETAADKEKDVRKYYINKAKQK